MRFTEEAGIVPHFAREEAERRRQYYLGPEHLLLGLLVGDENPMVRGLRAHGLDLDAVRAGSTGWSPMASCPAPSPATPSCWPPWGSTWTRSWPV